ncbi:UDP-glycosyltransferase family protein, partial [Vibrio parahaemolyticus]|nr:UDP-glycosyltransferase family protein [Vibrio parahaemolyticus]
MDYSHCMYIKLILDELIQKGHEVTVLRPSTSIFLDPKKSPGLKFETFPTSFSNDVMEIIFAKAVEIWTYEV